MTITLEESSEKRHTEPYSEDKAVAEQGAEIASTSDVTIAAAATIPGKAEVGRGDNCRRRRQSFDGAVDRVARQLAWLPRGVEPPAACAAAPAPQRERSRSCSSSSSSAPLLTASVPSGIVRPDDGDEDGATTEASRKRISPRPARESAAAYSSRTAPATSVVGDDGEDVVATATGAAAAPASVAKSPVAVVAAGNRGTVVAATDDISQTNGGDRSGGLGHVDTGASGSKRPLPLPLQPLAGRCSFEGCGKISCFRCRRCRTAFYCGREHQRGHWARHRGDCEEGRGEPPPPLSRLALPSPAAALPQQQQQRQKAVGWADSTPSSSSTAAVRGGRTSRSWKGGAGGVAGATFRQNRSLIEAAMASNHSRAGAAAAEGASSLDQVRNARGGTSWTVPASSGGRGAGSAAVWPASSSSAGGAGGGGGDISGRGSGIWQGGVGSAHPPPGSPPPPPGPPPPAKTPPPVSRPLMDKIAAEATPVYASADVGKLTDMGFDGERVLQALMTCSGSVERAAEFLLTGFGGGDGDGDRGDGDGVNGGAAHGPHWPGAGGRDGDGGGLGWLGGGTELSGFGKPERGGGGGGGAGGGDNGDNDDLITTADASDVGQGLDMFDFWNSEKADGSGGGGGGGVSGGDGGFGWERGPGVAEDDDGDLVRSYEDTVGGVQADVAIFFRPAPADDNAPVAPVSATSEVPGPTGEAGKEVGAGVGKGRERQQAVLTVVVRPLPSTAPASVDSSSSRGTEYDLHDSAHQTEHVVSLCWSKAEDLARRHETAQALRAASSTAAAAAAAAVGAEDGELAGPSGSGAWRQAGRGRGELYGDEMPPPLSPSSPLRPTSRSYDDGVRCSPSWGQKNKVGGLIVAMMDRRFDGGYQIFAPEVDRDSRYDAPEGGGGQDSIVERTYERPRGRSLPKWDRGAHVTVRRPPSPPPPTAASTWGSIGSGLLQQPWDCQACTFFNESPAFRSACEMCRTPRPSPVADFGGGGGGKAGGGGKGSPRISGASSAIPEGGEAFASAGAFGAVPRMESAVAGSRANGVPGMDRVADAGGSDNDGEVDGMLGGLSPGGGATLPAASTSGLAASAAGENAGASRSVAGAPDRAAIGWEGGKEWQGFGNASFGHDFPVSSSSRQTPLGFSLGDSRGDESGAGAGSCAREGSAP